MATPPSTGNPVDSTDPILPPPKTVAKKRPPKTVAEKKNQI